ncbi:uncharacterized protein LOC130014055 [Patella vulgata]|uniref:uncharacterized protein LOC130014055 n=1 Tax=Patella vulgata TaxID=6465 RepID=UPI0024A8B04C|nr:uncharacterized protein LOC130014055 [Patella vulgata]
MISCEKVDNILNSLFHQVYLLEDWITRVSDVVLSDLVKPKDPSSYIQLLKTTKVCIKKSSSQRQLDNCFSPTQNSFQREIIMRVIERILRKDEKSNNVLVLGFSLQSENPNTCISKTSNIELRYPNSASNRLQYSSWELLLSRIGDCLMEYLLEMTSIFLQVPDSSCYIQVTGEGANDMTWKLKSKSLLKSSTIVHRKRKWKGKGAGFRPRYLQKKFTNVREKDKQLIEIEKFAMHDRPIQSSSCVTQDTSPPDSFSQTIIGSNSVNEVSLRPTKTCDKNIKQSFISLKTKRKAEASEFRNSKRRKLHQNGESADQNEKQIAFDKRNENPRRKSRCEITPESNSRIADINTNTVGSRKRKMCHDDLIKGGQATFPSSEQNDFRLDKRVKIDESSSSHTDHDAINPEPGLGKIQAICVSTVNDKVQVLDTKQVGLKCNNMVDDHDANNVESKDCKPYNFHQPLRRTSLFYCKNLCEKIPKFGDLEEVVSQVTNISVGVERHKVINFPPEVGDMFQVLLSRYKKFPWYSMLNYHCPINIHCKLLNGRERYKRRKKMRNVTTAKLLESYTTYQQVYLFLKVIIKRIIPLEMFGCQENRNP